MRIAVLLTVFNRKDSTLRCLMDLQKQMSLNNCSVEVYLTNDGCTDGTPEAVKQKFPNVHIIDGDGNLFWNRGMYAAWEEAAKEDYDFYLWLNDDTFVYPNMLSSLLLASSLKDNKSIIVAPTCSTKSKKITYGGRLENGKIPEPNGAIVKVNYFNGNIVLIPRSVYKILGNLDYYFTHSKGDFDYGLRAIKNGIEVFQYGEFLGECDTHASVDRWCDPKVSFKDRWVLMHRPNGMPPKETFHLEKRHYGFLKACFHYMTIHLRVCFPKLWLK